MIPASAKTRQMRAVSFGLMVGLLLIAMLSEPFVAFMFLVFAAAFLGLYFAAMLAFVVGCLACEGAVALGKYLNTLNPFRRNA